MWSVQTSSGTYALAKGWSTKWRARSKWNAVSTAWPTAPFRRSVTRTTTVLLTRRASSSHTTLRALPTQTTLSMTAHGAGGAPSLLKSSKPSTNATCISAERLHCTVNQTILMLSRCKMRLVDALPHRVVTSQWWSPLGVASIAKRAMRCYWLLFNWCFFLWKIIFVPQVVLGNWMADVSFVGYYLIVEN